jgi:hypothetical protein
MMSDVLYLEANLPNTAYFNPNSLGQLTNVPRLLSISLSSNTLSIALQALSSLTRERGTPND